MLNSTDPRNGDQFRCNPISIDFDAKVGARRAWTQGPILTLEVNLMNSMKNDETEAETLSRWLCVE